MSPAAPEDTGGPRSPLRQLRPTGSRWVGLVLAAGAVAALGWFVGFPADRVAVAAAAVVVLALVTRTAEPVEGWWPEEGALPTRPGWHGVAATQRLLETARTDAGDRAAVRARLDRLPPADPGAELVRRAVGLTTPPPPTSPTSRSTA